MGFFSREKKSDNKSQLPDIPGMPLLPDLPPADAMPSMPRSEIQPLPSLPRNSFGESLGMNAIKNSVSGALPPKGEFEVRKIDFSNRKSADMFGEQSEGMQKSISDARPLYSLKKEPVFIKLDKFQDALTKFNEVKTKISSMENALGRLRETKDKEEQELRSWEGEMQLIKEKVASIDISLFSRI